MIGMVKGIYASLSYVITQSFLTQENSDIMLLENGDKIIIGE